ncbi:hypothetical protein TNIN_347641 [Trichonephila inaurata madagascariensis]|uniref:Uncharacterized protein n=1 Tax=Trichonephila inaurata madagascariensis TaxID=2747483 RepID=A0A8X7CBH4_9ARAC|nr:hypothetical protein TNIN_347641 [Trichonephila inaurata madagascariensis]
MARVSSLHPTYPGAQECGEDLSQTQSGFISTGICLLDHNVYDYFDYSSLLSKHCQNSRKRTIAVEDNGAATFTMTLNLPGSSKPVADGGNSRNRGKGQYYNFLFS